MIEVRAVTNEDREWVRSLLERGKLMQRSFLRPAQLDRAKIADLLERQSRVAEALERVL